MGRVLRGGRLVVALLLTVLFGAASLAGAETVQKAGLRVTFEGNLSPTKLPRSKQAPVQVAVSAKVSSSGGKTPPQMQTMTIAINKYGHLNRVGVPVCGLAQIQPATTEDALAICRDSLVGKGTFSAAVLRTGQAPFPSSGKVYAFNGEVNGKPAILAHVYGTQPAPASYTIPFLLKSSKGTYGTTLKATLPPVKSGSGYVTGISLNLGGTFKVHGRSEAYFSASCPAPKGFRGASFSFARASVGFQGGPTVGTTLTRTCQAKG
jgi:hypothetical protein